jgi:hypothetical protein
MDGLLVAMRTQRLTRGEAHEIGFALQPVNGTGEIGLTVNALPIGRLPNSAAKWGTAQHRKNESANHRQHGDKEGALKQDDVHIVEK